MKKLMVEMLLGFGLLLLLNPHVNAQVPGDSLARDYVSPCQSEWTAYNNLMEKFSIVRSNSENHVVYIQEKDQVDWQNRHTFIVRGNTMTTFAVFSTTFFPPNDPYVSSVEISDMRLFGGCCYFCGVWYSPFMESKPGFVGYFRINDILNGSGQVYYQIFTETNRLERLAISRFNGSSLLISAIGTLGLRGKACILELENTGSTWKKRCDSLSENHELVFSDIMTSRDSLTLLVQYKCSNDNLPGSNDYDYRHQQFLLDRFGLSGCYHSYNPSWVHYMANYIIPTSESYNFHYNKAPMRLFHINDVSKEFGVAFGVVETDGINEGIRLFPFRNAWEYDSCIYYRTGLHAEIKDVGNLHTTHDLFVLSQDYAHTNGMIAIPSLGGSSHDVTWLTNDVYTFNSLTQKIGGEHIDISGHGSTSLFHLFDQNIHSLSSASCFNKNVYPYEVLPKRHAAQLEVHWYFSDIKKFEWRNAEITHPQLSKDVICIYCE